MAGATLIGRSTPLIEDEPLIALNIQQELEREGAQAQPAPSLASAARMIECSNPSAAIVDFVLPDGDAGEICALLQGRGIPFVLHSGYPDCRDVRGAATIIPKPANPGALVTALGEALSIGKLEVPHTCGVPQVGLSR